jgi:hypothetical protein
MGSADMTNEVQKSLAGRHHGPTLWIKRLMATQLKLFRLEVLGQDRPALIRVGALLVFGPFLLVGYAFALASVVRYLAIRIGWGVGLMLVGSIHLAVGVWGLRRGRAIGFAQSHDGLAPDGDPARETTDATAFENAVTLVSLHPPAWCQDQLARSGQALGTTLPHHAV